MTRGNKSKGKKNTGGGAGRRRGGGRQHPGPSGPPALHALVDNMNPWAPDARPKVPDEASAPSVAYRRRVLGTINKDGSSHNSAIRFLPRTELTIYNAPTYTGAGLFPVVNWGSAADAPDQVSLETNFDRFRIVNWGVRITSVGAPLNSSGYLTIITSGDDGADGIKSPSDVGLHKMEYAIQPGMDIVWLSKPLHNRAREYGATTSVGADVSYNWTYPYIFLEGATADTSLRYELVYNYELLPKEGTVSSRFATPAAPDSVESFKTIRDAFNQIQDTYQCTGSDVRSGGFLENALHSFTRGLGGQAGRMLASIAGSALVGQASYGNYQPGRMLTY